MTDTRPTRRDRRRTGVGRRGLPRRPRCRGRRSGSRPDAGRHGRSGHVPSAGQRCGPASRSCIASGYDVLRGQKVGIVTNPTGVLPDLTHEVDVMAASDQVDLVAVFGPEHGFRGTAQAGGSEGSYVDERTGLTVYDTYLKSGDALADIVRRSGVDTMVFDIQDAGARFYTYIWTMYDCMVAAAVTGKRFVVLDRPNPTTGRTPRGPVLDRAFATFVGRREICQQHGMTVGELALLFDAEFLPDETDQPLRGRRRADAWLGPPAGVRRHRAALGPAVAQHADPGHRAGLPGHLHVRGDQPVRGPRHDPAVRAGRRAVRRRAVGRGARARRDLPGVAVREAYFTPTFSKHVEHRVRRRAAARDRPVVLRRRCAPASR